MNWVTHHRHYTTPRDTIESEMAESLAGFGADRAKEAFDAFQAHGCLEEAASYRATLPQMVEL